jgi:hypothetical protein
MVAKGLWLLVFWQDSMASLNGKIYRLLGYRVAIEMLRPNVKRWEIIDNKFSVWEDERPMPTMEEIIQAQNAAKKFEDSINTIYLPEQLKQLKERNGLFCETK